MSAPSFLSLPPELRTVIYAYLLDPAGPRTFYADDVPRARRRTGAHPAILRTCRLIHSEAVSALYTSQQPWRLDLGDQTSPGANPTEAPAVRRSHRPAPLFRAGFEPAAAAARQRWYAQLRASGDAGGARGKQLLLARSPAGGRGTASAQALARMRHVELGLGMAKLWRVEPELDGRPSGACGNLRWQVVVDALEALLEGDRAEAGEAGSAAAEAEAEDPEDGPSPWVRVVEAGAEPEPERHRKMLTLRCLPQGAQCTRRSRWEFATWVADRDDMSGLRWIQSDKVLRMAQSIYMLRRLLDRIGRLRDVVVVRPVSDGFDALDHWRAYWER